MRRDYIRTWDTTRPTRHILDIKLAKNLLSWGIKMVKIINLSGQKCILNEPLYCPKNTENLNELQRTKIFNEAIRKFVIFK